MSLRRSKSLSFLNNKEILIEFNRTVSESSAEVYIVNDTSESDDVLGGDNKMADSGLGDRKVSDSEMFLCMEQKIDRLTDMFLDQCRLLTKLKEEIRNFKNTIEETGQTHNTLFTELLAKAFSQRIKDLNELSTEDGEVFKCRGRATMLLNAIETKQSVGNLDKEIADALINFLQSDELKEQMVHATAQSVKDVIDSCLPRDFSNLYLPIVEHSHRRLVRHITKVVEEAFVELEENSASLSRSVFKTSKTLRRALERHQSLLEAAIDPEKNIINTLQHSLEELLQKELKVWRERVLKMFTSQLQTKSFEERYQLSKFSNTIKNGPTQPEYPDEPEYSVIDQLMISANLKNQIGGDLNYAFERALSASDLSLVMCACRSVDPTLVFAQPCKLTQHVLLSLIQQLSTDMVHDTQLKCRYLEDAIINLNITHPDTRTHLPLVVQEIQRHLKKFLISYPNHMTNRRVTLIVMAVNNLIK